MDNSKMIRTLCEQLDLPIYLFEKEIGVASGTVSKALQKDTPISKSLIWKISKRYPHVSEEWLTTGNGEMFLPVEKEKNNKNEVRAVAHENYMEVPYLPAIAQAGYVSAYTDRLISGTNSNLNEMDTKLVPREYEKGNYLVVEIVGDSMDDGTDRSIAEGDKLLVKELERDAWNYKLNNKRYLFLVATREGVVCKQITDQDVDNKVITCHSFNPVYRDYILNLEQDVLQLFYVKKIVEKQIRL